MFGPHFVRGNLVRDAASLNKVEMLPWDGWGLDDGSDSSDDFYDHVAPITVRADFDEIRALYEDERIRVPDEIVSFWPEPTIVRL
jgi:hypothetical protein